MAQIGEIPVFPLEPDAIERTSKYSCSFVSVCNDAIDDSEDDTGLQ
eukprot:CAMPEP_0196190552 /NCGR_PEP_ID=MMETSP0911-20130528/46546_1 /TAXON_ID=49265 /ORGANISM="Thalassiosira rotula, Strain GSO102" /LENGTH=45 /DNA_ID= /DNA_START= /DNA_END= /DNA_ORIENTATION=